MIEQSGKSALMNLHGAGMTSSVAVSTPGIGSTPTSSAVSITAGRQDGESTD